LDALDDIQRLRIVMDSCFLRVWEGLDHLNRVRTPVQKRPPTESRAASPAPDEEEEEEEQAEYGMYDDELDKMGRGSARQADGDGEGSLSSDEITELGYLSSDVVRILDAFAEERAPDLSRATTRPSTPH
jgi:small subunit ribosomal protein S24e